MLEDSQFHCLSDAYLDAVMEEIEAKDNDAAIEVDMEEASLVITLHNGKQFVLSKHEPTHQLWLSSPISGGLHFKYNEADSVWQLDGGQKLGELLAKELSELSGVQCTFES